jgi:hypothetical protein
VSDVLPRRLQPELLDLLPADDPRVRRCRRDLRLINGLMGNHRWLLRQLARHRGLLREGICELGAGDGAFLRRLHRQHPRVRLSGFDRAPRPVGLPREIEWHSGDVLERPADWPGGVLIANLFLHHLEDAKIESLGGRLDGVKLLLIGEGHRRPEVLRRSRWLNPLLGEVARHDMAVSLAAGFVAGELAALLGLSAREWDITEESTLFGALRLMAVRRG